MKRIAALAALAALVTLTACTPLQLARYYAAKAQGGDVAAAADTAARTYLATKALYTAGRPCEQWYDTAMEAGWLPEDWPTLSRVMWGESRCDPGADNNSSSARGLMQILDDWANECGISYTDYYRPDLNLACALEIQRSGGWNDWSAY